MKVLDLRFSKMYSTKSVFASTLTTILLLSGKTNFCFINGQIPALFSFIFPRFKHQFNFYNK